MEQHWNNYMVIEFGTYWIKIPASFLSRCLFLCDLKTVKDVTIPETTAKLEWNFRPEHSFRLIDKRENHHCCGYLPAL